MPNNKASITITTLLKGSILSLMAVSLGVYAMLPTPENPSSGQIISFGTVAEPTADIGKPVVQPPTALLNIPMQTMPTYMAQPAVPAPTNDYATSNAIYAHLVTQQGESEFLVPITPDTAIKSGDVVEYSAYYINQGDRIRSMKVQLDVPESMEFVGGASPAVSLASIDGEKFVRSPIRGRINGVSQELPLSLYKSLRWDISDVGLNGVAVVKFRAKLK